MKKKEKSPEEIKAHEDAIIWRRRFKSLATRVKNNCTEKGLHCIETQLQFLKDNPVTKLPDPLFSHEQTIEAWEIGIESFKLSLTPQKQEA